jgi:hypothetical protein
VKPFREVVGKAGIFAPLQKGPAAAKVGVTLGLIITVLVAVVAHCPAVGVKV